jgi:sulfopyruvate decarboxylase TPP-binding subunit
VLVTVNRVGNNRRLRLSDENKIASLGSVIAAPLLVTRVYRTVTTEAIVTADVVLGQIRTETLTLCGLGVGGSSGEARDGDESKDGRMHF